MPKKVFYWGPRFHRRVRKNEQSALEDPEEDPEYDFDIVLNYIHSDIFDEGEQYVITWEAIHKMKEGVTEPHPVENLKVYFNEEIKFRTDLSMKVSYAKHVVHKFDRLSQAQDLDLSHTRHDKHYQWVNVKLKKVKGKGKGHTVDELHLNVLECRDAIDPREVKVYGQDCWGKFTVRCRKVGEEYDIYEEDDYDEEEEEQEERAALGEVDRNPAQGSQTPPAEMMTP